MVIMVNCVVVALLAGFVLGEWDSVVPTVQNSSAPDPQNVCHGYKADNVVTVPGVGFTATLGLVGRCDVYGVDIGQLGLSVQYQSKNRLAVSIVPTNLKQDNVSFYELPDDALPQGHVDLDADPDASDLIFEHSNEPSFWFKVARRSTGDVLFSTEGSHLVFENQFVEFRTQLPQGHNLFGLGETIEDFKIRPGSTRTLYNADIPDHVGANLYGSHPFYMEDRYLNGTAQSHGVYLRNAHPQEVLIGEEALTWRTIGGSIELYFFSGPNPTDVIRQYQDVVGYPAMQQYWTLGFHHCRWGYATVEEFESVVDQYKQAGIPVETFWSDLDYMDQKRDFTFDPESYPLEKFQGLLNKLHSNGQHYVPLVDAAINVVDDNVDYNTYHSGVHNNVFMKNGDDSIFVGEVWPGPCAFPDFLSFNISHWWVNQLDEFHRIVPYDGIWLDMNEVSSFCTSEGQSCDQPIAVTQSQASDDLSDPNNRNLEHPPYAINNSVTPNVLGGRTMPPSAVHANGVLEYDWHNLYGYDEARATYVALVEQVMDLKRPFLISRSTFAGSGKYTGHWGGDNHSKWPYLRYSISQGLSFSMFGIPVFGTDTCGFLGNADEELCNRWSQLNAFFSFYRNHNDISGSPQEYFIWPSVEEAAKKAIEIRYWLLPYMYTLLFNANYRGDTFLRALSWEFPADESLVGLDSQFMVGDALMVAPVLDPGVTKLKVTFPRDSLWYDWYTDKVVKKPSKKIKAPLGHIPLYIRGGSILPLQSPGSTTSESRQGDWTLVIALDDNSEANGELYLDDGESLLQERTSHTTFTVKDNVLTAKKTGNFIDPNHLSKIKILGVKKSPKSVRFNSHDVDFDHKHHTLFVNLNNPSSSEQTVLSNQDTDWLDHITLKWM